MRYIFVNQISGRLWICDDHGSVHKQYLNGVENCIKSDDIVFLIKNNNTSDRLFPEPITMVNSDWENLLQAAKEFKNPVFFWFSDANRKIVPTKEEAWKNIYSKKEGDHVLVSGGKCDQTKIGIKINNYTFDREFKIMSISGFCSKIIELFKTKEKANTTNNNPTSSRKIVVTDIQEDLSFIKKDVSLLSEKIDSVLEGLKNEKRDANNVYQLSKSDKEYLDKRFNFLLQSMPNISSNEDQSSLVEHLKDELSQYRTDFYFKTRKDGLDGMIDVLDYVSTLLFNMRNSSSELVSILSNIVRFVERTMENKYHVICSHSSIGDPFDGSYMRAYSGDMVKTMDIGKKECVAHSVSPAVYWTLPRVEEPSTNKYLYKEELVVLYE